MCFLEFTTFQQVYYVYYLKSSNYEYQVSEANHSGLLKFK